MFEERKPVRENTRKKVVTFRLSELENEVLDITAERRGMNRTDYILSLIRADYENSKGANQSKVIRDKNGRFKKKEN